MSVIPGSTEQLAEELAGTVTAINKIRPLAEGLVGQWNNQQILNQMPTLFAAALMTRGFTKADAEAVAEDLRKYLKALKNNLQTAYDVLGRAGDDATEIDMITREAARKANAMGDQTFRL
jgi:hypothetical protein